MNLMKLTVGIKEVFADADFLRVEYCEGDGGFSLMRRKKKSLKVRSAKEIREGKHLLRMEQT